MRWQVDEKSSWWEVKLIRSQVDESASWLNGKLPNQPNISQKHRNFLDKSVKRILWLSSCPNNSICIRDSESFPKILLFASFFWNGQFIKWQVDEMVSWWNGKLMKWQVDETTSWWNDKLMKRQVDEMTSHLQKIWWVMLAVAPISAKIKMLWIWTHIFYVQF